MTGNSRGQAKAAVTISKVSLMSGQCESVLTMLLSCQDIMSVVGDASLLASHTTLLMDAYVMCDRVEDAITAADSAIELMKAFSCLQLVSPDRMESSVSTPSHTHNNSSPARTKPVQVEKSLGVCTSLCKCSL